MNLRVHHEVQQSDDVVAHFTPIDNVVNHSVFEKKLGLLEVFRQLLTNSLLDNSRTSETYQRFWFGDYHISKHRKTCRYTACGWISQYGDKRQTSFVHNCERGGYFGHLH